MRAFWFLSRRVGPVRVGVGAPLPEPRPRPARPDVPRMPLTTDPKIVRATLRAFWLERDATVPARGNPFSPDSHVNRWIRRHTLLRG